MSDSLAGFLVDGLHPRYLSLVVELPALCESEFAFKASILQIQAQRDQRQTLFRCSTDQLADLAAVQQELTSA